MTCHPFAGGSLQRWPESPQDLNYFQCRGEKAGSFLSILVSDVAGKGSMETSKLAGRTIDGISVFRDGKSEMPDSLLPDDEQNDSDEDEGEA